MNVLPYKVMDFCRIIGPPFFDFFILFFAPFLSACDVSYRSIKPNVPVVARAIGDFKTKIGGGP